MAQLRDDFAAIAIMHKGHPNIMCISFYYVMAIIHGGVITSSLILIEFISSVDIPIYHKSYSR